MGGGPESQTNTWNFVQKNSHFFKKIKCSKQPKKQNKLNFYFSLSGVPKVRVGWVGSDVWDKVQKKNGFLLTLSLFAQVWWFQGIENEICSPDKKSTPQNDARIQLKQVWKGADGSFVCSVYFIMYTKCTTLESLLHSMCQQKRQFLQTLPTTSSIPDITLSMSYNVQLLGLLSGCGERTPTTKVLWLLRSTIQCFQGAENVWLGPTI